MDIQGFTAGPFRTNTYIVAEGKRAFIVDPGMDSMSKVLSHDYDYEAIVLTHGHIDHTREAGELAQELDIPFIFIPQISSCWILGRVFPPRRRSYSRLRAWCPLPISANSTVGRNWS